MFKIIVAGSRTFNDYTYLKKSLDKLLVNKTSITIISGTARGADQLGERYAQENGYNLLSTAKAPGTKGTKKWLKWQMLASFFGTDKAGVLNI